ncbi:hypothetical protein C8A05DRAFT_14228 [Staphylotrichum tortipilum]|uniref:Dihydroorotate dehydrogenase (fumarate) n=1 Tax=Staphylotrichum tortipilum TaxID=2831512 RepID=A0AAN6RUU7_9PEZI|nr:hypothetical protein C8A05DRAFT_14228 [Staphylotrichum longicolle]
MAGTPPPPPPPLDINPPLINTACPWATTLSDLRLLYACPSTGAVTTRTSLLDGFPHDDALHQFAFFHPSPTTNSNPTASLNTLGYSPLSLSTYLSFIKTISDSLPAPSGKGFIVSVTGTPDDIAACYSLILAAAREVQFPLAMEINLSCPNIPDRPPPAYSQASLAEYLDSVKRAVEEGGDVRIPVGVKTPPYTYATQFMGLVDALEEAAGGEGGVCPISFITATNTLGSCLLFNSSQGGSGHNTPALPGQGIGGMAGAPLHPLALGNVATIRRLLDEKGEGLGHVRVIGGGGEGGGGGGGGGWGEGVGGEGGGGF